LGPAPCWFIKEQVCGKVPLNVDLSIKGVNVENGRVSLQLTDSAGNQKSLTADHVIAATGYKVDLRRLSFIDADTLSRIQCVQNTPVLSSNFESSVPGLYFVGASAANTFGPLLRFAFGAGFTARRLSKYLSKVASRKSAPSRSAPREESVDRNEVAVG
jgi:thioredoxin reductase